MLLPFDWAVLTVDEAKLLMDYIEKSTATKAIPKYEKMEKLGMLGIYNKLSEFVEAHTQYVALRNLDIRRLSDCDLYR